jgi:predicted nucleic-acid-binding Zn-ribbon protein
LPVAQKDKPINHDNPIRVFPDGSMWCAVSGDDIESGHATFDRSPIKALEKLLNIDDVIQATPHAVWEVDCKKCGHHEVSVAPYPIWGEKLECSQCGHMNFIEQDVM